MHQRVREWWRMQSSETGLRRHQNKFPVYKKGPASGVLSYYRVGVAVPAEDVHGVAHLSGCTAPTNTTSSPLARLQ
jgi:hypothetical protein